MINIANVATGILVRDGLVLIALRPVDALTYPNIWEFPGGKFEDTKDRDIDDTLVRELREELGVEISNPGFLVRAAWHGKYAPFFINFFLIDEFEGTPQPKVAQRLEWVHPNFLAAYDFMPSGAIVVPVLKNHLKATGLDEPKAPVDTLVPAEA